MGTGERATRMLDHCPKDFSGLRNMEKVLKDIDPDFRRSVLGQGLSESGRRAWLGEVQ